MQYTAANASSGACVSANHVRLGEPKAKPTRVDESAPRDSFLELIETVPLHLNGRKQGPVVPAATQHAVLFSHRLHVHA